jgi:D-alanyl-D-alanine carboxypeptidase/D-alanyl-D-alanine-endopeptidase (penicillin-binding protein 4)
MWLSGVSAVTGQALDRDALAREINRVIDQHPIAKRTDVCLRVVDLESGKTLYDRHGERLMTPASNLKMYTTACALAKFGPQHRFVTSVVLDGTMKNGRLVGDVILVGGGDGMLRTADLAGLAEQVVTQHGLARVAGAVRVDNSRYGSPFKGPGWMWDDDPFYFNMSITPLMLDFNVLAVRVSTLPDGTPQTELVPSTDYPPLLHEVGQASQNKLNITRRPFEHPIRIFGGVEVGTVMEERRTMHDPGKWAASVFRKMLIEAGVTFDEPPIGVKRITDENKLTIEHRGVTLRESLKHFNKESENAIGEVLLHEIAIAAGINKPTWPDGAGAITKWLNGDAGLERDSFRLVYGSGLSRYNLISAQSATQLLEYMSRHNLAAEFLAALPTYDIDVAKVQWSEPLPATAGTARVNAKSGFMSGVSTSSGVIRTLDDRPLAFSYLTAGFIGSSQPQRDLRQQLWEVLVRYRD